MNFTEALKEAVQRVEGAVSALIIGADGIPVAEYSQGQKLLDLEDLGAEASQMIKDINMAAEDLGLGEAKEFSIVSDVCGILMRKIVPEYYLALVIRPEGNYGKGRFVLKSLAPRLEPEFL
jgi:predicted regulator of Ras-like GTPase activity (Roadblock/LC7/MglB family)